MAHPSKHTAFISVLVALKSMPTQTPVVPQAFWLVVQSSVQRPLPTPPGSTAEMLSVGRMQVSPTPQSASALQPAPILLKVPPPSLGAPPDPPVPVAPPAP